MKSRHAGAIFGLPAKPATSLRSAQELRRACPPSSTTMVGRCGSSAGRAAGSWIAGGRPGRSRVISSRRPTAPTRMGSARRPQWTRRYDGRVTWSAPCLTDSGALTTPAGNDYRASIVVTLTSWAVRRTWPDRDVRRSQRRPAIATRHDESRCVRGRSRLEKRPARKAVMAEARLRLLSRTRQWRITKEPHHGQESE